MGAILISKRLRRDSKGNMPIMLVAAAVVVLFVVALFALTATNPHRLVNSPPSGENFIVYTAAKGNFRVLQTPLVGTFSGAFDQVSIDTSAAPPKSFGASIWPACILGCKGEAWVRADVSGPDGLAVEDVVSEKTSLSFGGFDGPKSADFTTGTVGVWKSGNVQWKLTLVWELEGTQFELATATVAVEV